MTIIMYFVGIGVGIALTTVIGAVWLQK